MNNTIVNVLINFSIFQCGWLAAVYWHSNLSAILVLLLAIANIKISSVATGKTFAISFLVALIGILNDYALLQANVIQFSSQHYVLFPSWLAALWLLFVSTFSSSMAWIKNLPILTQAIIGGLGGAISYVIGTKMGAMQYNLIFIPQILFHFANWFLLFPLIFKLFNKLNSLTTP